MQCREGDKPLLIVTSLSCHTKLFHPVTCDQTYAMSWYPIQNLLSLVIEVVFRLFISVIVKAYALMKRE